jgi:hypothetical protein
LDLFLLTRVSYVLLRDERQAGFVLLCLTVCCGTLVQCVLTAWPKLQCITRFGPLVPDPNLWVNWRQIYNGVQLALRYK